MPRIWPHDVIRELLARAELCGSARATLASAREAKLFRFAIYSFRDANDIGQNLTVTINDKDVIVTKRELPTIAILQEERTQ